jgi:hypothetical protein
MCHKVSALAIKRKKTPARSAKCVRALQLLQIEATLTDSNGDHRSGAEFHSADAAALRPPDPVDVGIVAGIDGALFPKDPAAQKQT